MQQYLDEAIKLGMSIGTKILGAVLLWIIGRYIISLTARFIERAMTKSKVDETLIRYAKSSARVLLNVVLVIAVLGVFGVQTTTFAAVLAAGGIAIGMAWSGMLSNFAAGVFLIVLRPVKAGDFVTAGDVTGTVQEIGLFVTSINTPDNVLTYVGNAAAFAGTIKNFTANPYRRVDLTAQLTHEVDVEEAMRVLRDRVTGIDHVRKEPMVDIEILEFNLVGPVLAVRPYCHTDHYWQVYFDTNRAIREAFAAAKYPIPRQRHEIVNVERMAIAAE